ncbi:MAG: autotransporter domain-containing protein [Thiohalocapsa sp.]
MRRLPLQRPLASTLVAFVLLPGTPVGAQTWTGEISTDWNQPFNWSGRTVPDGTSDVVVSASEEINVFLPVLESPSVIEIDADLTVAVTTTQSGGGNNPFEITDGAQLTNNNAIVGTGGLPGGLSTTEVNVKGLGSTWETKETLTVGQSLANEATITVSGGGFLKSSDVTIAQAGQSSGAVNVTGPGSQWVNANSFSMGSRSEASNAALTISDGGVVTSGGGTGEIAIVDFGGDVFSEPSTAINIGAPSDASAVAPGTLNVGGVSGTGLVNFNHTGSGYVFAPQLVGDLSVLHQAGNTTFTAGNNAFTGQLRVEGGTATFADGLGKPNAPVSLITVGKSAASDAGFVISDGSIVNSSGAVLGDDTASRGQATIDGPDAVWNSTTFRIGNNGDGTLTITDGGTLSIAGGSGTLELASATGSTGTLNIGASATQAAASAGKLDVGSINFGSGDGTLVFNHTETDYEFDLEVAGAETIEHFGGTTTLTANNAGFEGDLIIQGGTLAVLDNLGASSTKGILTAGDARGDDATMSIAGAEVTFGAASVGVAPGSNGTVTISSFRGSLTVGDLSIGDGGTGAVNVTGDGRLIAKATTIGQAKGSTGILNLTGENSTLTAAEVVVGHLGDGSVALSGGALLGAGSGMIIGDAAGSSGVVTVADSGSILSTVAQLVVGNSGTGSLTLAKSGEVEVLDGAPLTIAAQSGSSGTLNIGADAGAAAVAPGVLSSPKLMFGNGAGALVFNHTGADYAFATAILGKGSIDQDAGTTRLTADSTGFTGDTTVEGGTLEVTGQLGSTEGTMTVAGTKTSAANLLVTGGGVVGNKTGVVGGESGALGTVQVTGSGSKWTNGGALSIGGEGVGTLNIADMGEVSSRTGVVGSGSGSLGTVNVTGAGSSWLNASWLVVGDAGSGTVKITNRGRVAAGDVSLGVAIGSKGTVAISGQGASLSADDTLVVGVAGSGTMAISGGASATSAGGAIAQDTGSDGQVTVAGNDSQWMSNGPLTVGSAGTGEVTIAEGGEIAITRSSSSGPGQLMMAKKAGGSATLNIGAAKGQKADAAGTLIASAVVIGEGDGRIVFNHTEDRYAFEPAISGNAVMGHYAGTTTLVADNSAFTGSVLVAGGTLRIGGALGSRDGTKGDWIIGQSRSDDGAVSIFGGAKVASNFGMIGEFTGAKGSVSVSGAGSQWTTGNNITVGVTVGNSGTGELTVSDGGTVTVGPGGIGPLFLAGNATSVGTLTIGSAAGGAAAALGGAPNLAAPGTVNAGQIAFGDGTGKIVFNHADVSGDYEFASEISTQGSGDATIVHSAGVTKLTGDSSGFDGTTTIDGGTLWLANTLGGKINVGGGTLTGNGVATGKLAFDGASTYLVELEGSNPVGVTVDGSAQLAGLVGYSGSHAANTPTKILTAKESFDGTEFAGVIDPFLFITPTLSYDTSGTEQFVLLTIEETANFSDVAFHDNHLSVARAMETLDTDHPVFRKLLEIQTVDQALESFQALSGEIHPSIKGALVENSQILVRTINRRLDDAFVEVANPMPGPRDDSADEGDKHGVWMSAYGSFTATGSTRHTAAMDNTTGGVAVGVDAALFGNNWRIGGMAGYDRTHVDVDGLASTGKIDGYSIGAYGGGRLGLINVNAGAIHTWYDVDTERSKTLLGRRHEASYDARAIQLFAQTSVKLQLQGISFAPFAGVSSINLHTDGFAETGSAAAVVASSDDTNTTFTALGLRATVPLIDKVKAHGMIGWRHAFGDIDPTTGFTIGGSAPFSILGAPIAQDAAVTRLALQGMLTDDLSVDATYEGQYSGDAMANSLSLRMSLSF